MASQNAVALLGIAQPRQLPLFSRVLGNLITKEQSAGSNSHKIALSPLDFSTFWSVSWGGLCHSQRESMRVVRAGNDVDELRREWKTLCGRNAPRISRDLLALGISFRRQEMEHGGLAKATVRKLAMATSTLRKTGRIGPAPMINLKPGTRLLREWHGRTHTITATEDAFEYEGQNYTSLSKVAKVITGAHWSGPRFFGLQKSAESKSAAPAND